MAHYINPKPKQSIEHGQQFQHCEPSPNPFPLFKLIAPSILSQEHKMPTDRDNPFLCRAVQVLFVIAPLPWGVFFWSAESLSAKCLRMTQIFRARKPADMATPSAIPMMAYLKSEAQGRIELSCQPPGTFQSSLSSCMTTCLLAGFSILYSQPFS